MTVTLVLTKMTGKDGVVTFRMGGINVIVMIILVLNLNVSTKNKKTGINTSGRMGVDRVDVIALAAVTQKPIAKLSRRNITDRCVLVPSFEDTHNTQGSIEIAKNETQNQPIIVKN